MISLSNPPSRGRRHRSGLLASWLLAGAVFFSTVAIDSPLFAAVGDRTLSFYNLHTQERATITYKRNGVFDPEGLRQINHILRDWRRNETIEMDRRLIDLVWEVYQASGSRQPINIICGYRAPATNSMLRSRSSGVAENSQHTRGKALDFALPDVPLRKLRDLGLQAQVGGVGYYPSSGSPFVHLDVGSVRHWPRLNRQQLVEVFPNGHTLHIPSDGRALPHYAEAQAAYRARGSGAARPIYAETGVTAVAALFSPRDIAAPAAPRPAPAQATATAAAVAAADLPIPPAPRPAPRQGVESPAPMMTAAAEAAPAAAAAPAEPDAGRIAVAALPEALLDLPPVPRRNPAAGPAPARTGVTLASAAGVPTALPAAKPDAPVVLAYAAPGAAGVDPLHIMTAPAPVAAPRADVSPPVPTPQPAITAMFAVAWAWDDPLTSLTQRPLAETTLPVFSAEVTTRQAAFAQLTRPDTTSLAGVLATPERALAAGFGRAAAYGDLRTDRFAGALVRTVAMVDLDDLSDRTIRLAAAR